MEDEVTGVRERSQRKYLAIMWCQVCELKVCVCYCFSLPFIFLKGVEINAWLNKIRIKIVCDDNAVVEGCEKNSSKK